MAMKCVWIRSLPWENAGFGNGARGGHRHAGTGSTVSPVLWTESRTSGREPESIKNDQRRARYYLFKCGTRRRRAGRGKQGNGTAEPERECRSSEDEEEEEEHVAGPPRAGWRGARMRRLHPFRDTRLPPLK